METEHAEDADEGGFAVHGRGVGNGGACHKAWDGDVGPDAAGDGIFEVDEVFTGLQQRGGLALVTVDGEMVAARGFADDNDGDQRGFAFGAEAAAFFADILARFGGEDEAVIGVLVGGRQEIIRRLGGGHTAGINGDEADGKQQGDK